MNKVLLALLVALLLVPEALAGGPEQTVTPWDRTRVIPAGPDACSFPIQVHSSGTIRTWTYPDGTVKTILNNFHIEWMNVDTGLVAKTPLGGPVIVYPDGTVVVNGNNGRFIAKGEGIVVADLGRTVTTVEGVIFAAGLHSEALFPDVCAALD